jgi:ribokinase
MPSIVVVGSINLDIVATAPCLPAPGETVTDAVLARYPGGTGANQALAAQRLGADVALIGRVGKDAEADAALALLREADVDLSGVLAVDDAATGIALIAVAAGGENQIIVAPGANLCLASEVLELPAADALIGEVLAPGDAVARAVVEFEGFTCVNLATARDVDDAVLRYADLIVVNESEAAWYRDRLALREGLVATTFGASGAALVRGGEEVARVSSPPVEAVDTTGAGDTFTAALTLSLIEGQPLAEALRFACAAGAAATQHKGAQPSLPTREEVQRILRGTERARGRCST